MANNLKKNDKPNLWRNFGIFLAIFIIIAIGLSLYQSPFESEKAEVGVSRLIQEVEADNVASVEVSGSTVDFTLDDETVYTTQKEISESLSDLFSNYGVDSAKLQDIKIEIKGESGWAYWLEMIFPFLIPFILIVGFIYLMMRNVSGQNNRAMMFGQVKKDEDTKKNKREKITFNEVAGAKEAKEELEEVVEFLKNPKKFTNLGAKIPKGVLLVGAPGTGKTLLARAVSGEAAVPFYHISGSEFVEMFVGVGASRVRDLFKKAKKTTPCIVFIDEIDAVGRQRGAGLGGSHDEREQTLNQILVEMDGFDTDTNIIVIAATNRPDILDPALLRPGRFDRRVALDLPDIADREAILKVHSKNKPLSEKSDLRVVAQRTPGFSGADLANLLNEAAISAGRENKKIVSQTHLLESIEKVMLGPERKSRVISDKEKEITAYHEAGHALISKLLPESDPVQKISIISRGSAGGYTLKVPENDKHMHPKSEFIADLAVLLGGHVAEKIIYSEVTTGASSDLRRATQLARKMVAEFGMSEVLGPRTFGEKEELIFLGREISEQKDYSEKTAEQIDDEVSRFINNAFDKASELITQHKKELDKIVKVLLEKETIEREEFEALFEEKKEA